MSTQKTPSNISIIQNIFRTFADYKKNIKQIYYTSIYKRILKSHKNYYRCIAKNNINVYLG